MDHKKEIINRIQKMSGKYSVYEIFGDWIKMLAISISNMIDVENYVSREKEYLDVSHKYSGNELQEMCQMNAMLTNAYEEKMEDVLGYIYMHLEISSSRLGQFFTPYHICQLMAKIQVIPKDELILVNEPSCGAGGNVIAFAEKLKEDGIDYQNRLLVTCQDLDWKAVYMCYVQLSLYGIPAVVVQGNTLSEPYTGGRIPNAFRTPMYIINEYKIRRESNVRKI